MYKYTPLEVKEVYVVDYDMADINDPCRETVNTDRYLGAINSLYLMGCTRIGPISEHYSPARDVLVKSVVGFVLK